MLLITTRTIFNYFKSVACLFQNWKTEENSSLVIREHRAFCRKVSYTFLTHNSAVEHSLIEGAIKSTCRQSIASIYAAY